MMLFQPHRFFRQPFILILWTGFLTCTQCLFAQPGKIGINTMSPTEALDINGKIRIREGAKEGYVLVTDSAGTARWQAPAILSGGRPSLCITDFGAKGDGTTDNTAAIQKAVDSAAFLGGNLCVPYGLYRTTGTISLPAGVRLEGSGTGSTMTGTPFNGSVIKYAGNGIAIRITGTGAGLSNLVVYNENNSGAAGGILLEANGSIIESCRLTGVLVSGFTDGTALRLSAVNNGGITYCTFDDIRIRHAKTGIHLVQDNSSFVNSNQFNHGAISGGGFDYCLRVESGNNNQFNGLVMEPYSSAKGHLVVEGGSITGDHIRIEGSAQPPSIPLIEFKPGTYGSFLDGVFGGGLVLDGGHNAIHLRSGMATEAREGGFNCFQNACFFGLNQQVLPGWQVSGNGVQVETLDPGLRANHRVLKLIVPPGVVAWLKPDAASLPSVMNDPLYDFCNFGYFVKCNQPGRITVTFNAPAGMVTAAFHPGDDEWHFTGMSAAVNRQQPLAPCLRMDNASSGTETEVYITAPTFCFGQLNPVAEAKPITSSGGIVNGTLSTSLSEVQAASMLVLPKEGNVFIISGNASISRINHQPADRFPKGTIITLLFNQAGCSVVPGPYLTLKTTYLSVTNASLTLVSMGDGTWREVQRNL